LRYGCTSGMQTPVALIIVGAFRRWWVPGWLFDKTEARAEKAENQSERTIEALAANTEAMKAVLKDDRTSVKPAGGRRDTRDGA
jgi:hypothetical protein